MEAKCDTNLLGTQHIFAFRGPQHIFALSTWSRSGNISTSPHSPPLPCLSSNQLAPEVTVPKSTDNPALEKGSVENLSFVFPSITLTLTWARGPWQPLQVCPQPQR